MKTIVILMVALTWLSGGLAMGDQRKPAGKEFTGEVEINSTSKKDGSYGYDLIQIIDKTNKVVCYGKISQDSSTMSCVKNDR